MLSGSKKAPVPPLATHACLPLSCHGRIHAITFLCHMCLWGSSTHITSVRPSLSICSNFPILAHSSAVVDRRLSINFLVLPSGEKGSRNRYISGKKAVGAFFFGACCQIYIGGHTWIRPRFCSFCFSMRNSKAAIGRKKDRRHVLPRIGHTPKSEYAYFYKGDVNSSKDRHRVFIRVPATEL